MISGRSASRNSYKMDNATNQSIDWIRTGEFAAWKKKKGNNKCTNVIRQTLSVQ